MGGTGNLKLSTAPPRDAQGAEDFFDRDDRTKKEFEKWAVGLIKAYPRSGGKKGADGGIDGLFWFGRSKNHKAAIGVLLTLTPPTRPMLDWAAKSGTFDVDGYGEVSRLQIVTIEDAIARKEAAVDTRMRHADTYKAAPKEKAPSTQGALDL